MLAVTQRMTNVMERMWRGSLVQSETTESESPAGGGATDAGQTGGVETEGVEVAALRRIGAAHGQSAHFKASGAKFAGLAIGVAMLSKYTAVLVPAAIAVPMLFGAGATLGARLVQALAAKDTVSFLGLPEAALALAPDGIFLSNGPGDPEPCDYAIAAIREFLKTDIPVFGICLGHQLLGLAAGAKTVKMKFGHHGANHPVIDVESGRVMISSQNHGFAVDETTLPQNVKTTHRSLFDGSLQGITCTDRPAFSFQGHPEASPGPHDSHYLFEQFVSLMRAPRSAPSINSVAESAKTRFGFFGSTRMSA